MSVDTSRQMPIDLANIMKLNVLMNNTLKTNLSGDPGFLIKVVTFNAVIQK